jgi:hypothetical protein
MQTGTHWRFFAGPCKPEHTGDFSLDQVSISLLLSIGLSYEYRPTACMLHRPLHFAALQVLPPAKKYNYSLTLKIWQ